MTSLIHPCQKRALIPSKFEVVFNYDTFFKVAQSYPHGPKLAQLTVLIYLPYATIVCHNLKCKKISSEALKNNGLVMQCHINLVNENDFFNARGFFVLCR